MRSTLLSLLTMVVCSSCSVLTPEPAEPQSATAALLQSLEKKCEKDIKRTLTDFPAAFRQRRWVLSAIQRSAFASASLICSWSMQV